MARGKDTSGPRIGPSYRGQFYQYVKGEQLVTAQWPKPRGKPRSEDQHRQQIRWRCVCWSIKALPAATQNWARTAVQDSPFLPRDILVAMLYGRGPQLILPDRTRITNLATRVNMSEVMDNIAYEQGDLLFRGRNIWQGLPGPTEISTLIYDPATKQPLWLPGTGGGGALGSLWNYQQGGVISGSAFNCKGSKLSFSVNTTVSAVMFQSTWNAANDYRCSIYEINTSNLIVTLMGRYALTKSPAVSPATLMAEISPAITFAAGTIYAVTVEVTNQGATHANPMSTANGTKQYAPWIYDSVAAVRMAKVTPVPGDTFDAPAGDPFKVALRVAAQGL